VLVKTRGGVNKMGGGKEMVPAGKSGGEEQKEYKDRGKDKGLS